MQADYALWREIMRARRDVHPNPAHLVDLCWSPTGRTEENIRCHVQALEDDGLLKVNALSSTASQDAHAVVPYVRLSHPLAADRFPSSQSDSSVD